MSVIGPRRLSAAPGAVEAPVPPGVFRRALADLRDARPRTEVRLREIPAPEGQAPFAVALAADVCRALDLAASPSATDVARRSRAVVRERFGIDRMAAALAEVYGRVASEHVEEPGPVGAIS